jgi:hypothetical protein
LHLSHKDSDFLKSPADYPKLNLPACRLRVTKRGGSLCVWDAVRGRWLVLTLEEWVRRHVLSLLTERMGVPAGAISQEYPVDVNGTAQRADIVVSGADGRPVLVVECKAPEVDISQSTLSQAFRYNAVLGARYVMLTNGLDHYIYEVTAGTYTPLRDFPDLFF